MLTKINNFDIFKRIKNKSEDLLAINFKDISIALLALFSLLVFIPTFTAVYFAPDLTSKERIMNRNNTGLVLYDRNGEPFFEFYQGKVKTVTQLAEIPDQTKEAIIAIEDKDFYQHVGFSLKGIGRSLYRDLTKKELAEGGSTITQQLVKNSLLTSNKSFLRKLQEITLAFQIEQEYPKDQILEMYLNSVYFGEGSFGIEEASQAYFGKDAKDLTLAESAMLAGILPSPSKLSPLSGDLAQAKVRQNIVLQKMVEQKFITPAQKQAAENQKLTFNPQPENLNKTGAHFALMVRDQLVQKFGEEYIARSGFKVRTSLDLKKQEYAEKVVAEQVKNLSGNLVSNGSAVVMDPKTGEVLALVGSKNWFDDKYGKVNVAISPRSPGSSFKPIVYALAMEKGIITPSTILHDQPTSFVNNPTGFGIVRAQDQYKPQNYDRKFRGLVTARRALANSLNVPAVEVMSKVGVPAVLTEAKKMGINTLSDDPSDYGLSLTLGTGEVPLLQMTNAYSVFANQGERVDETAIIEILDKKGGSIYRHQPKPERVLSPEVSFLISSILSDNRARQEEFGNALTVSRPAAVKTGTSESYRDALTIGYTPSLVIGVWVGNNDSKPMTQIAGSLGAAPIWKQLIEKFSEGTPIEQFTPPSDIAKMTVCTYNGLPLKDSTATSSAYTEYFIRGTEPVKYCNLPATPAPSSSTNPNSAASPQPTPQPQSPTPPPQPDDKTNVQTIRTNDGSITIKNNGQSVEVKRKKKDRQD